MHPLAYGIRQPPHRQNVAGPIQGQTILAAQAFASDHLVANGQQARIIGLEWVLSHLFL